MLSSTAAVDLTHRHVGSVADLDVLTIFALLSFPFVGGTLVSVDTVSSPSFPFPLSVALPMPRLVLQSTTCNYCYWRCPPDDPYCLTHDSCPSARRPMLPHTRFLLRLKPMSRQRNSPQKFSPTLDDSSELVAVSMTPSLKTLVEAHVVPTNPV